MSRTFSRLVPVAVGLAACCSFLVAADPPALRFDLIPKEHQKDGRY